MAGASFAHQVLLLLLAQGTELAATVTSGYLPDLDTVLSKMSGICFDYAALMTGMLRSQGVPTKLVIGYAGDVYHAWINVYSSSTGWVEGVVYFDGVNWQRMDPTFASSGGAGVMDYIGDGTNYSAKYIPNSISGCRRSKICLYRIHNTYS